MESLDVAVVIPALNEAATIAGVVREIPRALVREIIVADGGSNDGTAELARAAGAQVIFPAERGYGCACAAGTAAVRDCGIIVFMDGDGADRGDLMAQLIEPIRQGTHDFVIASRTRGVHETGAMGWHQVAVGYLAGLGMRLLYRVRYSDMCAYRAIRRECLGRLDMREMTYGWNIEMQMKAARLGLRILEIPMPYRRRAGGRSKVAGSLRGSLQAGWRIAATFIRVATSHPSPSAAGRGNFPLCAQQSKRRAERV
jgi:glycosyltransferase involved in cell wall biosynthesis